MQHNPITTKQTIKRAVIYALMTLAVIIAATVMVLLTLGYRFDRADRSVEQVGLVQLGSQPSGASVKIEGTGFRKSTNTKTTLPEGVYNFEMSRDGYRTWRKDVPVKSGKIVWLTYPRLLPKKLEPKSTATIKNLASSVSAANNRYIATTNNTSELAIYDVGSNGDVSRSTIALDKKADFEADKPRYQAESWSANSDSILVKRTSNKVTNWLIVNRRDKSVLNINKDMAINPSEVQFQPSDSRYVYVLSKGELRRLDTKNKTLSRVQASNVTDFSIHESTVVFSSADTKTKQRSASVIRSSDDVPLPLETVKAGNDNYQVAMGTYYGDNYIAIVNGDDLRIYTGKLSSLSKDSNFLTNFKLVYQTSLDSDIANLNFKTSGRFVVAELEGEGFGVYDIEMQRLTTVDQDGLDGWVDGYLTYSDSAGQLTVREFDGGNQRKIAPSVTGQAVTLDQRGRNLYWFSKDKSGDYHLMSAALRV